LKYVFDTEAILKFYLGEDGAAKVLELLRHVQNRKVKGYISIINLTEFYYILYSKSPRIAEMTKKITHGEHPDAVRMTATWTGHPGRIFSQPPVSIEVISKKGRFSADSTDIPGDTWNPRTRLTDDAIIAKFRNNASYVLKDAQLDKIIDVVSRLDEIQRPDELTGLLSP